MVANRSLLCTVTKGNEKKVACDRTEKKEGERSQSKVQTIVLVPSALAVENTYFHNGAKTFMFRSSNFSFLIFGHF